MVNVPPPLLCSTPPPIDFGEDDDDSGLQSTLQLEDADEYSEYGLVTDTHEATLNAKMPTLPELPISSAEPLPSDLSNGHEKPHSPVEAFNYQVKTPDFVQQMAVSDEHELEDVEQQHIAEEEEQEEEDDETNTNDNVPSLKLDSLSLYSNESISPTCTLSPVADEQAATKVHAPIVHQVTLEDVSDDSDKECSPKKPKELFIPEGAADFFAIEILQTPTQQAPALSIPIPETKQESALPKQQAPALSTSIPDIKDDFATFPENPALKELNGNVDKEIEEEDDDFGDFGDFADFSAAPAAIEQASQSIPEPSNDDGFDDFQDFATPSTTTEVMPPQQPQTFTNVVADVDDDDDDDDDDFGDFAEPTFVSAPAMVPPVLPQPPAPTAAPLSIDERVKPVLELMFPKNVSSSQKAAKQAPLAQTQSLHFGAIEQAHALDYQWASSEMRHSLVRSLAIDSRNILFGDKWNSSMPRFAANLSFDPLKPLKPLSAAPSTSTSLLEPQSATSWRSTTQQPNQGLEAVGATAAAAATTQANQIKAQPGTSHGQGTSNGSDEAAAAGSSTGTGLDDTTATTSVFAAATATAPISPALSADGNGHSFDDGEQLAQQHQQQQLDLRKSSPSPTTSPPTPSPSPPPPPIVSSTSFALPLKETHIYTPSKSDTAVAKTTTLAPIDFDYEIASAGIIIDETVVKKEYRDVEYKPPPAAYALDSPSKLNAAGKPAAEDDDFSDFQSVPAMKTAAQLQPPRNGTPTFGEQMILSPAILLPQSVPLAKPSIEWGDNALASINAEEMARIEELFSHQYKPPTISATVAHQSPKQQRQQQQQQQQQQKQQQEDDEWSDFVSVPVQQQQQQQKQQQQHQQLQQNNHHNHNNNKLNVQKSRQANAAAKQEDDWSDFVSSNPLPAARAAAAAPQFNSGAWQSANFYNNPLSLYQHQQQPHAHSNLVPKYPNKSNTVTNNINNNNSNNNNNNNNVPQQIHMMHDFSTVPTATANAVPATYQQQHHQHHQKQLQQQRQQQQRQQFHLGNAKVAPRISLIPDLSFVAPALPTNAGAFMSSLPKPSFSTKK